MQRPRHRSLGILSLLLTACPSDDGSGAIDTDAGSSGTAATTATMGDTSQGPGGPDGGPGDTTVDPPDTATTGDTTSDPPSTTGSGSGPGTDDGPSGCVDDDECDSSAPFCSGGACVPCSDLPDPDGACASATPQTPLCSPAGCVQCTARDADACAGDTPVCDDASLECVGCWRHDQCDTACNLDTGACMPDAPAMWVRRDANNCGPSADGTFGFPFCTLQEATDAIDAMGNIGTIWLSESVENQPGVDVPAGMTLAIRPAEGERPVLGQNPADGTVPIYVDGANSRLYLEGVSMTGFVLDILVVDGTVVWLDRVDVFGNQGYALDVRNGAEVHVRSSIIASNGRNSNLRGAVYVEGSTLDLQYASVVANYATMTNDSLQCDATSTVTARNSIIAASDSSTIQCAGIDVTTSFVDTAGLGGVGNVVDATIGTDLALWFVDPGGIVSTTITYGDDFHLTPAGATLFGPIGEVQVGDLPYDFELDPRPAGAGAMVTVGADEP